MAGPDDISSQPTLAATGDPDGRAGATLAEGTELGEYRIEGLLGRGGMGAVYRARHRTLDRISALKLLNTGEAGASGEDPRFLREARNNARLEHHNIVTVYNAGLAEGRLFIEMQLVDGRSLGALGGPVEPRQATRYVEQVAHALHHAHGRGIVHRDIKPDNLLLTTDGVVKVTDFGLAKQTAVDTMLTAPGSLLGTPTYMAPEQWRGEPADARTDIYALGATYFQLVTGQPPFKGKLPDLLHQHMDAEVPLAHELAPEVPPAVSELIRRMMAKRPEDRPQSATELITALRLLQRAEWERPDVAAGEQRQAAADEQPVPKSQPAVQEPSTAIIPRRPGWLLLGLLWLATAGLVLTLDQLGLWQRVELDTLDARVVGRSPAPPAGDRVSLVLIDDRTAKALHLPFDRELLAQVVEGISGAGARAVALDLLIADPLSDTGDLMLAGVTEESAGVIHAMDLFHAPGPAGEQPPQLPPRLALSLRPDGLVQANRAVLPIPVLVRKARLLGNVGLLVDEDGVIRRVPLLIRYRQRAYPALGLAAVCQALGVPLGQIRWQPGRALVLSPPGKPPVKIPVDRQAAMRISVRGSLHSRPTHSFLDVLELVRDDSAGARNKLRQQFAGRVVLMGVTVSGQQDIQPMPGLGAPPLVLAHAMTVETILGRDFVQRGGTPLLVLLVGGLALLVLLAGARLPWFVVAALVPLGIAGYWLLASAVLSRAGLALPVIAPCVALAAGGLAGWGLRFGVEQRQRRLLAAALGRYLPRRVSARILADPRALQLGGQRKELSLVEVRLQGFGALSEQLEPEEVGQLLSAFFDVAATVVIRHDGTLDRFSGEGVRAFFNDPLPCPDHGPRAVACALELRREVLALLGRWARGGRPRPRVGVGVHTGYVTVGNIGAVQRMEYTAVGRNVEIVGQLAEAAPPGTVLVSARTRGLAEERFIFEERGNLAGGLETAEACAPR